MENDDKMTFTILEDGTIKTEVDGISAMNHASADKLVKGVDGLLAGKVKVEQGKNKKAHTHTHGDHTHTHEQ